MLAKKERPAGGENQVSHEQRNRSFNIIDVKLSGFLFCFVLNERGSGAWIPNLFSSFHLSFALKLKDITRVYQVQKHISLLFPISHLPSLSSSGPHDLAFRSSTAKLICGSLMEAYGPHLCICFFCLLSGTQKGLNSNPESSRRVNNTVVASILREKIRT